MEAWQKFLSQLEKELGPAIVKEWIPKVVSFDAWNLYLEARDSFQISWFEEHIRPRIKNLVNNNQRPIKVHVTSEKKDLAPKREDARILSFKPDRIESEFSLENFAPSQQNLVVYKLLTESNSFNPIYLYGSKGVGKTHLLMGTAISLRQSGKKVFYVNAQTFTEHVVQAIRLGQMQEFRKIYRDIDVLIIDDIDIFSRKAATQEEFFHTFNTLHTSGRQILISANVAPMQLNEIEPRLVSRFEWGISLAVQKSDVKTILEKKAAVWNKPLSEDLLQFLIEKFPKDPIMALQALVLRCKDSLPNRIVAEKILKDVLEKEQGEALTPDKIVKSVALHYGITSEDLLGQSQMREYTLPRQMAMYLCREKLKIPFQKIGELFKRDHSTVMSSVKQIQKAIDEKKIEAIDPTASI